jgi:uncharacterized protein (TIGR00369 family)
MTTLRVALVRPNDYQLCYGCGHDNRRGLSLDYFREGDTVVTEFVPAGDQTGYPHILHGGVTATLIDETFGWVVYGLLGKFGMTTEMSVSFRASVRTGTRLLCRGRLEKPGEREVGVAATVTDPEGKVVAEGRATLRLISPRALERLGASHERP